MVEYTFDTPSSNYIDAIFASLADPVRRDILERVREAELTISEIALPYDISFAAISKHLKTLEAARLICKRKAGRERLVQLDSDGMREAHDYLKQYETFWTERYDALEKLVS